MSTLSVLNPTLLDLAKATDPDGKIAKIVEMMNLTNEVLEDMTVVEGNLQTGHQTTVRTGIPEPTWRKMYQGVVPNKGTTAQVTDSCGMLEAYAEIDKALADLNGNKESFRLSEDKAHIEGMNQEIASTLFYGNEGTEPEAFTGLAPRFNSLSAQNADNIISAGGSGNDTTSIWLVIWGENSAHGIVPKGSKAGMSVRDLGEMTVQNSTDGSRYQAYVTHYRQDLGLTVRDWRQIIRIPNIDVSDLAALTGTQAITAATSILKLMTRASERVQNKSLGRAAFYVNRTVRENLRLAILDKISANLSWETVAGKRVMTFDDIPVRRTDALVNTESVVS